MKNWGKKREERTEETRISLKWDEKKRRRRKALNS